MGDAAQGEPPRHEVFERPLEVQPEFEEWNTPGNYRRHPGGKLLPPKLKVWRIQRTDKTFGGVVSFSYGFEDSPDAEILVPGFNEGKEYGAAGVSRHGNVLEWGFSAPPSQMTDAGRALFVNCICYARKFDGVAPLVRGTGLTHRMNAIRLGALIDVIKDKNFFSRAFGGDLGKRFEGDPEGLVKAYGDGYELIYRDRSGFTIDEELKALGIASNRRPSTLERLIALLEDEKMAATARKLLARYTTESFETRGQWADWLARSRSRLYFSDVGGYKFRIAPEGYPVVPGRIGLENPVDETWNRVFCPPGSRRMRL